jgi:hypothetical protein
MDWSGRGVARVIVYLWQVAGETFLRLNSDIDGAMVADSAPAGERLCAPGAYPFTGSRPGTML